MPEELPAVTVPSFANAGFKGCQFFQRGLPRMFILRKPGYQPVGDHFHLPQFHLPIYYQPGAAKYFSCDLSANASWASRLILN
jgi:hypothetical protein